MKNSFLSHTLILLSIAVLMTTLQRTANAQSSTQPANFETRFQNNLDKLAQLYCWNNSEFYRGKFQFNKIENIDAELQKLNLPFFTKIAPKTESYYWFLENLKTDDKKHLIKFFSFYEKEIETALQNAGLLVKLKYLAPALSAMNLNAVSTDRKAGAWQLTHFQAILNGIKVSKLVDERFSISQATTAAVAQLKRNFEQFKTPDLAVAAYILGNVKVRNAVHLATENRKTVTSFYPESFFETVAAFQAMAIFLTNNRFEISAEWLAKNSLFDTISISRQLHFKQVAQVLQIPIGELQFLNPQYLFSIVPGNKTETKLIVPKSKNKNITHLQDSIYNCYDSTLFRLVTQKIEYPPSPNRQYLHEPVKDLEIEGKTKIKYRLKSGDVLGIIAEDFDVRVADLKYWNNIYNERKIRAGRLLDIFVDTNKVDYYSKLTVQQKKNTTPFPTKKQTPNSPQLASLKIPVVAQKIEYTVKSGESPYTIAKKYDNVTPEEILEWNNINDARKIQIGQKLIVYIR
jgi:membrane-bound lytic murein transglycosylase D